VKIDITYEKNPAMGWDILVAIQSEDKERIAFVRTIINGFPEPVVNLDPNIKSWGKNYLQKGNYPGDNKVLVTATDDHGSEESAVREWTS
jgi:hypothetical protein